MQTIDNLVRTITSNGDSLGDVVLKPHETLKRWAERLDQVSSQLSIVHEQVSTDLASSIANRTLGPTKSAPTVDLSAFEGEFADFKAHWNPPQPLSPNCIGAFRSTCLKLVELQISLMNFSSTSHHRNKRALDTIKSTAGVALHLSVSNMLYDVGFPVDE